MSRLEDLEKRKANLCAERVSLRNKVGHIDMLIANRTLYGKQKMDAIKRKDSMLSDLSKVEQEIERILPSISAEARREAEASISLMAENAKKMTEAAKQSSVHAADVRQVLEELRDMRAKYLSFAGDPTRISSMRTMAAQMSDDITLMLDRIGLHK
jgi:DNA repair exonuclease SbcCD ATPase subunit